MRFKELSKTTLQDGTKRINYSVQPSELFYFGYLLETLEGYCNYTTVKKEELQVDVVPDFFEEYKAIIEFMQNWKIK